MSSRNDTLNLILSYLREEGPFVLATPEDAEFFRKREARFLNADRRSQIAELPPVVERPPNAERLGASPPAPKVEPLPASKEVSALVVKGEPLPVPKPIVKIDTKPVVREELIKISADLSGVRRVVSVVAPELAILNEVPNDAMARKIAERWKTKNQTAAISLLSLHEPPEQRTLLEQIAKAIDIYFGPAKIVNAEGIEKEKQWAAFLSVAELKMVIVCDYTLWQLNSLMQFYKETPAQGARVLGHTSLFLLPDLSLYLKDPLLKRSLWKALCQKLS